MNNIYYFKTKNKNWIIYEMKDTTCGCSNPINELTVLAQDGTVIKGSPNKDTLLELTNLDPKYNKIYRKKYQKYVVVK